MIIGKWARTLWQPGNRGRQAAVGPALLIVANIFVFGPAAIYQGNVSEFHMGLLDILGQYVLPAALVFVVLLLLGLPLPTKHLSRYVSILLVLGILLWVQGNILVWKYGVLGIEDIDWSKGAWRGWLDGGVWLVFLVAGCLLHRQIHKHAAFISVALLCLQLAGLGVVSVQRPEMWERKSSRLLPPSEIFWFSSKENVIHVVLDEFQSTVFKEIVDKDVEHYYEALAGFTLFMENLGPFPTTKMSIPALMTGRVYENEVPFNDFLRAVYNDEVNAIPNVLYENGYEVDIAVPHGWERAFQHSNFFQIPIPYGGTRQQQARAQAALMLNLVLFRHVPHFAKKAVLNSRLCARIFSTDDKNEPNRQSGPYARHFAHKAFLQDMIDNVSVNRSKPVYKFIHIMTTHYPAVLNKDGTPAGKKLPFTWENIKVLAKYSFDHFLEFFDRLKSLGIYDSSLIILHADHGYWRVPHSASQIDLANWDEAFGGEAIDNKEQFAKMLCSALPLLAIKLPYAEGPMSISTAQTALTDIPDTISSVLDLDAKFGGRPVFDIGPSEERERRFLYYEKLPTRKDDYFDSLNEFTIKGSIFDRASWRFAAARLPGDMAYQIQKITFGTKEGRRFLRYGWGGNEGDPAKGTGFNWALGESASLYLSIPKDRPVYLSANVLPSRFTEAQRITVVVDGKVIGEWALAPSGWQRHSVVIDPDAARPDVSVVKFRFSQHLHTKGTGERPLAVKFAWLSLNEVREAVQ